MRRESRALWEQALEDLETAKVLLRGGRYYAVAFFSHQAAEKALKAAYIEVKREIPPRTHNLVELGRLLGLNDVMEDLMELNPEYTISRYPDAANGVPASMYSESIAESHLRRAERVVKRCGELLKATS
ncbi:MAG: DNA-binding protein [Thermoproteota archaeon]|nr:MAG: DNA-binding protein [Candidatus Korarchaeota archaeon]